jgi:hypothetical protein
MGTAKRRILTGSMLKKKLTTQIIFFFTILIITSFLNKGYSFSQHYIKGYISCIISDSIPEEELDFYIKNERLYIRLLKRDLDSLTKEKLIQRLKKLIFLKK